MHSQLNPETTVVENLQQAETYLAKGKLDRAQAACQKVLEVIPDLAPGCKIQANISLARGQVEEAMSWYKKALAAQPDWAEVYANMGSLYAMQKQWQPAIASYQKAIALKPNIAAFYRNLAKIWQLVGKPELAAECSYQVLTLQPESATASEYLSLGKGLFDHQKLTEAIACYGRAIELNPNLFKAYHLLGDALIIQGSLDEAINYYQKAVKLQPNIWVAYQKLGKALLEKGEFAEAVINFQQAIEINPNSIWSYPKLGLSLMKLKKWDAAINAYRKAIEFNSKNGFIYNNLGLVLFEKKQWSEAVNAYKSAIDIQPNNSGFYHNLGKALSKEGKKEEAIACYSKVIELNRTNGDAYYLWGEILRETGRLAEALEVYQKGLQNLPKESQFFPKLESLLIEQKQILIEDYRSCAKDHKETGNLTEAIQLYQKVTELQPQSSDYYELGMLWMEKQDWEATLLCYEKVLFLEKKYGKESQISKYLLLGVSLVKNGKIKQVIDCYHRIFQKDLQNLWWYYWLSISLSEASLIPEAVSLFKEFPKPQSYSLPEPKINHNSSDSIYDKIWNWFNQKNPKEFDFNIEDINYENLEPEVNQIKNYFAQNKIIIFNIKKITESEQEHLQTLGISLEYLQMIALENNELENIYINYFNQELPVNPLKRTQHYPHRKLSTPDRRLNSGVEFSQTITEFQYMYAIDPIAGNLIKSNESFYLRDLTIIYRFVGTEVFYILAGSFGGWKLSLYIPKYEIAIILSDKAPHTVKSIQSDYNTLKTYFVTYFREVKQYIHSQQPRLLTSIVGFRRNLGHFFWQELNGIYYLYKNLLLDQIDCLAIGNSQHLGVTEIFPELKNKKQLILTNVSEIKKFQLLLKNNCLCLRVAEHFITQEYVSRIYDVAWNKCSENFRAVLPNRKNNLECFPLLWVNLRAHNKSWKSQEKGYANIINKLSENFPNIGIVFDGWIDCNEIVESIVKLVKPDIKIYSTLGCPLHESIVWAHQIDAYICVVGSGLVITSWLSDRPGVAYANQGHLRQQSFWSRVKENVVAPSFLRSQDIKQLHKGAYGNYEINWQTIYQRIFKILKKIEKKKLMAKEQK
ncbi:MAG: tetratricopeptide repeat protein [Okeania sp. SIO3I5]|uniref:tetratricopeptide repeat protein n=1 Tax=Okeania sp. SIO3I5 TaxID=2607805 RepID=UPI0013BE6413|nr:tetratricopeptide repeat protein [Okeania sp. SIO3I5]NEQ36104.1 tetratricopeptide repeat protein [Okeania sp. SIO3I5]